LLGTTAWGGEKEGVRKKKGPTYVAPEPQKGGNATFEIEGALTDPCRRAVSKRIFERKLDVVTARLKGSERGEEGPFEKTLNARRG